MKIVRLRSFGRERLLCVPHELIVKIHAEYMAVSMDDAGRLVYTPIEV